MTAAPQRWPTPERAALLWPPLAVALALAAAARFPELGGVLPYTALFDAAAVTAALVWLLTPRVRRRAAALAPVLLRGLALAALAFPLLREQPALWAGAAFLLVTVAGEVLRRPLPAEYRALDDLERAYAWADRLSARPRLLRAALQEGLMLAHLLRRPRLPTGAHFGTRRGATTGMMLGVVIFVSVLEGLVVHALLARWSDAAAWGVTALHVLSALWLLAYARALAVRPVTVGRRLYLRAGLHWTGSTPLANVQAASPHDPAADADALCIALGVRPNTTLTFGEPVRLLGLAGSERVATRVSLYLDDPGAFAAALGPGTPVAPGTPAAPSAYPEA